MLTPVLCLILSGSHWTIEILFLLRNNCDFELSKTTNVTEKHFFLDIDFRNAFGINETAIERAANVLGEPRILKIHSQPQFIEKPVRKTIELLIMLPK